MKQDYQKQAIEKYVDAYNNFDVDTMISLFHSSCRFENYIGDQITASAKGLPDLRAMMEQSKNIFSSRKQTIVAVSTESETVIVEISYAGRLKVDLPNGLKAGDELNLRGCSKFEFHDGLIKTLKDYS